MATSGTIPILNPGAPDASREERARARRKDQDLQLVAQLLARDAATWQSFIESTARLIYSRVLATGRESGCELPADVAEECVSDVLQTLIKDDMAALRRFEGRSRLSTWLAVVSRRVTLARLTRKPTIDEQARHSDSRFDLAHVSDRRAGPLGELTTAAERRRLQRCLARLKTSDQQALAMYHDDRRSYREIGRVLSISENAVGPKLRRAHLRLKRLWDRDEREAQE